MALDQLAHKRVHARDELRLAATAVRKECVVCDIDVARVGSRLCHFAKNGQPAEPGIEDEDGRCHGGRWYQKNRATLRPTIRWLTLSQSSLTVVIGLGSRSLRFVCCVRALLHARRTPARKSYRRA